MSKGFFGNRVHQDDDCDPASARLWLRAAPNKVFLEVLPHRVRRLLKATSPYRTTTIATDASTVVKVTAGCGRSGAVDRGNSASAQLHQVTHTRIGYALSGRSLFRRIWVPR